MSDPKNKGTLFSSTLKVEEEKVHLFFIIRVNPGELWQFCCFMKVPENPSQVKKGHKFLKLHLIQKIKALYFISATIYIYIYIH